MLIPLYRVPLVGLNGRKLVPGSQGILPRSRADSDLLKKPRGDVLDKGVVVHFSDSKSSTLSRASFKERASSTNAPFLPPPSGYSYFHAPDVPVVGDCTCCHVLRSFGLHAFLDR